MGRAIRHATRLLVVTTRSGCGGEKIYEAFGVANREYLGQAQCVLSIPFKRTSRGSRRAILNQPIYPHHPLNRCLESKCSRTFPTLRTHRTV